MCLITYSPKGKLLDRDRFTYSHNRNNDGMGFMYKEDDTIKALRFVGTEAELYAKYTEACANKPHALHQRFATSGGEKVSMAHPFRVLSKERDGVDIYLMHNGVIGGLQTSDKHSDTFVFVREILRPQLRHNPALLESKHYQWLIANAIGGSNKLLIMSSNLDAPIIINKSSGHDSEPFWFSNSYSIAGPIPQQQYKNTHHYSYKYNRHFRENDFCAIPQQNNTQASLPYKGDVVTLPTKKATVEVTVEDIQKKRYSHTVENFAAISIEELRQPEISAAALQMLYAMNPDEFADVLELNEEVVNALWKYIL